MNFKELVESSAALLEANFEYDEVNNAFSIKISFDDDIEEIVYVYQDIFEDDTSKISKKIIVCEFLVGKYDNSTDLLLLSGSNEDLFFSRAYISEEEEKILIESCTFMEMINDVNLSIIIEEIAQQGNYLKEVLFAKSS
jgi:hypothetical protein